MNKREEGERGDEVRLVLLLDDETARELRLMAGWTDLGIEGSPKGIATAGRDLAAKLLAAAFNPDSGGH